MILFEVKVAHANRAATLKKNLYRAQAYLGERLSN